MKNLEVSDRKIKEADKKSPPQLSERQKTTVGQPVVTSVDDEPSQKPPVRERPEVFMSP